MKKIALTFALIGLTTTGFAQVATQQKAAYTPETIAELKAKRLAIDLDLSEKQQKKVTETFIKQHERMSALKADRMRKTPEQKLEMENKRLDIQLALQKDLKKILSNKQYDAWKAKEAKRQARRSLQSPFDTKEPTRLGTKSPKQAKREFKALRQTDSLHLKGKGKFESQPAKKASERQ